MYRWNPSDYERNSSAQERAANAVIARLNLRGDEHILDIGCGDGKVTVRDSRPRPPGSGDGSGQLSREDRLCQKEVSSHSIPQPEI
jgi:trans-aconitate 2-methyltransferase